MLYKKHIYHAIDVELLVRLDISREVRRLISLLAMLVSPEDKSLCSPAVGLLILGGPDLYLFTIPARYTHLYLFNRL